MADRNFNIDILIKARNAASQELNAVARQIGDIEKSLGGLRNVSANLNSRINSVTKELDKLGFSGKNAGEVLDTSFSDLHERLENIEGQTHKVRKEMDALEKSQPWKTMSKDSAQAFANIDKLAKAMSNIKLTPAEERVLHDQLENLFGKKELSNFGQDFLKDYATKRIALERNVNREIFSERAKLEREIGNVVRKAQSGHQAQMEESLAKVAEINRRLIQLGDTGIWSADQMDRAFSHALGKLDSSEFDFLTKSIRAVGLASEEEAIRLEHFATQQRIAHLEELKNVAETTRNLKQLDLVRKEVAIEAEKAAQKQIELDKQEQDQREQMLRQTDALRRKSHLDEITSIRERQRAMFQYEAQLKSLARETDELARRDEEAAQDVEKTASRFGILTRNANMSERSLRELALSLQGFQVAVAIKYAQALGSALIGLGGELVSVAASAINAGAALGGSLAAGALSAIGPITLLFATLTRFNAIRKALNLRQTNLLNEPHQAKQQSNEANALADATDRVAEATARLSEERRQAVQRLEDLIDAEQRARLAALDSELSFESAERRARLAAQGGNVSALREADLGLDRARFERGSSSRDLKRAQSNLAIAKKRTPEGDPQVIAARRSLAAANRDLAKAQLQAADGADVMSAAEDRLQAMLDQLTPSEQRLYRDFIKLQDAYKAAFRPITDIIVNAFDDAIKIILPLFSNSSLIDAFTGLANVIGDSIRKITGFFAAPEQTSFLTFFIDNAKRNIGPLTDAFINLSLAFLRIGKAATPVLNFIVDSFLELTGNIADSTKDSDKLADFFSESKKDLDAWFDLAGGIWGLFTRIFSLSRGSGRKTIEDLAVLTERWTKAIDRNKDGVKQFFEDARAVTYQVARVVGAFAVEMMRAFNPRSVKEFADVLVEIVIPALGNAVRIMGVFTRTLHQFLSQTAVADAAKFIATIVIMTKSIEILGAAWLRVSILVGKFFRLFEMGTFGKVKGAFILIGAALTTLGVKFDGVTDSADTLFTLLGVAAPLIFFIAKLGKLAFAIRSISTAMIAMNLAIKANPFGFIASVAAMAITALGLFKSKNDDVKVSADDAAEALTRQKDAMRELRDLALEEADKDLALRNAKLRLAEAQINREKALKEARADGKITKDEELNLRNTKLALDQAKIDLERAKRDKADFEGDKPDKVRENAKSSQENIEKIKKHKEAVKDEVVELKNRLKQLKDTDGTYQQLGPHGKRLIDNSKEIHDVEEKLRNKQKELRGSTVELRKSIRMAGDAWVDLGGNANDFGLTMGDLMQYLEHSVNDGLQQFGAKKVKFARKYVARRIASQNSNPKGYSDSGPTDSNDKRAFATGGLIPGVGLRDTVSVMAAPGEGFLTRHQMPVVDAALRVSGMMAGGLKELWNRVSTPHYMARGGAVDFNGHPSNVTTGIRKLIALLEKRFPGLSVSSTTDHSKFTTSGNISDHYSGHAVDVAGPKSLMNKAARYILSSGIARRLKQGIYNPLLAINRGKDVGPGFFGPAVWAQHDNHLHLALAGGLGRIVSSLIPKLGLFGQPQGPMTDMIAGLANMVRKAANRKLSGLESKSFDSDIPAFTGGWTKVMSKIAEAKGWSLGDWKWIVNRESGGRVSAKNPSSTAFGLGQLLQATYGRYGGGPGSDGAEQISAMASYIDDRYENPTKARSFWSKHGWYSRGGAVPIIAHAGEMVLNRAQQAMLGGSRFLSGMFGGSFATGGVVGGPKFKTSAVSDTYSNIADDIALIAKNLGKGGSFKKIIKALSDLTAEDGPLSRFGDQIQDFVTRLERRRKSGKFRMNGKGEVLQNYGDLQEANLELSDLQSTRGALKDQRGEAVKANRAANKAVTKARNDLANAKTPAQKRAAKKNLRAALAGARGTRAALTGVDDQLTSNTEDIFNAQENLKRIAEEQFDDRVGLVNDYASRRLAHNDLFGRGIDLFTNSKVANILGTSFSSSSFGAKSSLLQDRNSIISTQLEGLNALLGSAPASKREELTAQIQDLTLQLAENEQAIRDNTDAYHTEVFNSSQNKFGFLTGTIGSGIGVIKAIGELAGNTNNALIGTLLGKNLGTLTTQGQGLRSQLSTLLGFDALGGATGEALITKLINLSTFDTSNFTVAQRDLFQSLIGALIENQGAIVANTSEIQALNGSVTQSFNSTAWDWFRLAIFNGSGGLMPSYQIPQMHSGGRVMANGLYRLAEGEEVLTRGQSRGDTTIELNITEPMEVADPDYFANLIAFKLKTN